jgi:uncharacterized membrane protein YuzA (DUF378 family)
MARDIFGTKRYGRTFALVLIGLAGVLMLTIVIRTHILVGEIEKSTEQQLSQTGFTQGK